MEMVMGYNQKARDLRRCSASNKDDSPCRAYSRLDSDLCRIHLTGNGKKSHKGIFAILNKKRNNHRKHQHNTCSCQAYSFKHRAGGGLCNWPDPPVEKYLLTDSKKEYISTNIKEIKKIFCESGVLKPIPYEGRGKIVEVESDRHGGKMVSETEYEIKGKRYRIK